MAASKLNKLDVFQVEEPIHLDILQLVGTDIGVRHRIHIWEQEVSDIPKCDALVRPRVIAPINSNLQSATIPVLCLVDALNSRGFSGHSGKCTHGGGTPKLYDERKLVQKRSYLQCLLSLETLLSACVSPFHSVHTKIWYMVLLKTKKTPPAISAKACKRLLVEHSGDHLFCALDDGPKHVVPIVPPVDVVPGRVKNNRLVDDDSPDEGLELVVASSSGPSSSSGLVRAPAVETGPVVEPLSILGAPVVIREEYARGGRVVPPQWTVQCLVHKNVKNLGL